MKLFISFSGTRSQAIAKVLRRRIPTLLNSVEPFMSQEDIGSGDRWNPVITQNLNESNFGILCLEPGNLESKWIHFEAGSLSKLPEGRVCGLLFAGLTQASVTGPVGQFQNKIFGKETFRAVLEDINEQCDQKTPPEILEERFNAFWEKIDEECEAALSTSEPEAPLKEQRESDDVLDELVTRVRKIEKIVLASSRGGQVARYAPSAIHGPGKAISAHQLYAPVFISSDPRIMMNLTRLRNTKDGDTPLSSEDEELLIHLEKNGLAEIQSSGGHIVDWRYSQGLLEALDNHSADGM